MPVIPLKSCGRAAVGREWGQRDYWPLRRGPPKACLAVVGRGSAANQLVDRPSTENTLLSSLPFIYYLKAIYLLLESPSFIYLFILQSPLEHLGNTT